MIWRFSDGTEVELGGVVRGSSALAGELRFQVSDPDSVVYLRPQPDEGVPLDVNDPTHVDVWLRQQALPPGATVNLTDRPDGIPDPPPRSAEHVPGVIY